jgi:hypothetical protein
MRYKKPDPMSLLTIAVLAALALWIGGAFKKANSAETTITWTPPTQRCDGTALTNLAGYSLTYGQRRAELPLTPLSYNVTGLTPGDWWFSLAAVDAAGERSEFVTVNKTVQPAEFVTLATPAYSVAKSTNRLILIQVGTVPLGTLCDATQSVNGHYAVPYTAVTWSGSTRPKLVMAKCS